MAKNKLSFDAIFEGNDIKEDAKKRISAMLEDVVATRMEAQGDEGDEDDEDDEKKNPEVEDEEKDHEAKETPAKEKKEHEDGDEPDEPEEEDEEVYEEDEEEVDEAEGDASDPANIALEKFPDLADDPEFRQVFRTLMGDTFSKLKPAFKATFNDLKHNPNASPLVDAFVKILEFFAKDTASVSRIKNYMKTQGQENVPDSMMAPAEEPINNEYSEAFTNKLDKYLTYVAEEWAETNKIALENGIKVQIAESFLSNMKGMYEQYNFTNIPTRDMVVELGTKVTEAEQKLNEQIEKNAQLRSKYNKQRKEMVVLESTKGLTVTQVEKFKKLTEDVAFEDEKSFKNKIAVIKENAFTKTVVKSDTKLETETGPQEELLHENTRMSKYVDTISRNLKY